LFHNSVLLIFRRLVGDSHPRYSKDGTR
jgi:hypothetical protein